MALSDSKLWRRLAEFEVSPPEAVFSFAKRLARENHWPLGFARRVFGEYRRFLYLRTVAGRHLVPSAAVDQTWQLHLSYPASYGQDLCLAVLRRPLSRPRPVAERARREAGYRATLAAYLEEFDCVPPAEIWPGAERWFATGQARAGQPARRPRRIDRKTRQAPAAPLSPAASPA